MNSFIRIAHLTTIVALLTAGCATPVHSQTVVEFSDGDRLVIEYERDRAGVWRPQQLTQQELITRTTELSETNDQLCAQLDAASQEFFTQITSHFARTSTQSIAALKQAVELLMQKRSDSGRAATTNEIIQEALVDAKLMQEIGETVAELLKNTPNELSDMPQTSTEKSVFALAQTLSSKAQVALNYKLVPLEDDITDEARVSAASHYTTAAKALQVTIDTIIAVTLLQALHTTVLPSVESVFVSEPLFAPLLFGMHPLAFPSEEQANLEYEMLTRFAQLQGQPKALVSFIEATLPAKNELLQKLNTVRGLLKGSLN